MTELPALVELVIVLGAIAGALGAIAAIGVKAFRVVRSVDEHFRRRESERIEAAAGRLIDRAVGQLGGRLDQVVDRISSMDRRQAEDERRRSVALADWEMWRAGVDSRLDLVEMRQTQQAASGSESR